MAKKNRKLNKNLSNSFVWLMMAAFFFAVVLQNFLETKTAKVSFSYQLESLVNLQLIEPEYSKKIALNDNLVTFSGKFKEKRSEESKARYKFLELLDQHHQISHEVQNLEKELKSSRENVLDSARWFLQLSGENVPSSGYEILDSSYNTPKHDFQIVITSAPSLNTVSYAHIKKSLEKLKSGVEVDDQVIQDQLSTLIRQLQSPLLGVGSQTLKKELQDAQSILESSKDEAGSKVELYEQVFAQIGQVINTLSMEVDHTRLSDLRSVRKYKQTVESYIAALYKLEDNELRLDKAQSAVDQVVWFFNNKEVSTRTLTMQDPELYHQWFLATKEEWEMFPQNAGGMFKAPDQPLNSVLERRFESQQPPQNYLSYVFTFLPFLLIAAVLYFLFTRQMKGINSTTMNFGKSPARLMTKEQNKITFKDVAGLDEEIEELEEIVDFLKNPHKFTALGGKIPKGVLLVGAPGTGKTLIGKAVAGEADRPFFFISGSDFVEMFVGVGASRIRDMFEQAKKNAPCIIFIDEIDAVGRHRGAGIGGGHDEREQTLNQLLVEMDGFDTNEGVIIMAATNRPDVLDKALLRPGRFDRRVMVNLPDIKGRLEILKVHARSIKLSAEADLDRIARATPGCSGADLANILNEAALLAARKEKKAVTQSDLDEARDKVLYGKERRSLELDENEKLTTAYHESGHTIVSMHVEHADPVDKVTIIPRGMSLGATMFLPKKNRVSYWRKELIDQLAVLMGGRCAEEIFVRDISSGARQDIKQATQLAHNMICEWGMSDKMGVVFYGEASDSGYMGIGGHYEKQYSDDTAKLIDEEIKKVLSEAHLRAKELVEKYRDQVELLTQMLMKHETLDTDAVKAIASGSFNEEELIARRKKEIEEYKKKKAPPPPPPKDDKLKQNDQVRPGDVPA